MSKPRAIAAACPIAVTMGEPAGIGGELSLLAWLNRDATTPVYFIIDDPDRLSALASGLGLNVPIKTISRAGEAADIFPKALPVLAEPVRVTVTPGLSDGLNAPAVLSSIDRAVALVQQGAAAAMVTNPIHKATLMEAGFSHPGHTEYLAERTGATGAPVMMLACSELRVVLTSIHLPLSKAIDRLSQEAILHCAHTAAEALTRDFGIAAPRLAVAGLNPHAGEQGHLGREEIDIVQPAIERLQQDGLAVTGPLPADTMFHEAARKQYDAAICLYHDQALIPLKTIDFDGGVNITLGIPIVRTSPDHGTAFDIAGTGRASPRSLMAALTQARQMADHRTHFNALSASA